jgi:thiosulfate/3-mercaptopyruvate sulfurtransferase
VPTPLISPEELHGLMHSSPSTSVICIDATYYRPDETKDALQCFELSHIPKALFFDLNTASDATNPLPHMLPTDEAFYTYIKQLGITPHSHVVIYDQQGLFSAPRAWWMFQLFGLPQVSVLNGGLPAWQACEYPVEEGTPVTPDATAVEQAWAKATPRLQPQSLAQLFDVQLATQDADCLIVDARPEARFKGLSPEPRQGLRAGHIPTSINLPYTQLVEAGKLVEPGSLLRQRVESALGISLSALEAGEKHIISTCGSGVTACILMLALHHLGIEVHQGHASIYDGSWAEWGSYSEADLKML